jgi:hypothetical protein
MRPVNLSFDPRVSVCAALPDGRSWSGVGKGMTDAPRRMYLSGDRLPQRDASG